VAAPVTGMALVLSRAGEGLWRWRILVDAPALAPARLLVSGLSGTTAPCFALGAVTSGGWASALAGASLRPRGRPISARCDLLLAPAVALVW